MVWVGFNFLNELSIDPGHVHIWPESRNHQLSIRLENSVELFNGLFRVEKIGEDNAAENLIELAILERKRKIEVALAKAQFTEFQ
jgi:hypothetical protein